jgi:hypothetical protein
VEIEDVEVALLVFDGDDAAAAPAAIDAAEFLSAETVRAKKAHLQASAAAFGELAPAESITAN